MIPANTRNCGWDQISGLRCIRYDGSAVGDNTSTESNFICNEFVLSITNIYTVSVSWICFHVLFDLIPRTQFNVVPNLFAIKILFLRVEIFLSDGYL